MNVYDFDKTIYDGDCTIDFYLFCIKKKPSVLFCLPRQIKGLLLYVMGVINKTQFKELFFCFLNQLDGLTSEYTIQFWDTHEHKIKPWYRNQKTENDLIISASPNFLLQCITRRLGICNPIASLVDENTGHFIDINCYGEEKVKRYLKKYPSENINIFYTDSISDRPLAEIAEKAYLVKKYEIRQWDLK